MINEYNALTGEITERELTPEEIAQMEAMQAKIPAIPYADKVVELIRQRYSLDEELAIQRQRDTKPAEFQEYFDFCEECKQQAKQFN